MSAAAEFDFLPHLPPEARAAFFLRTLAAEIAAAVRGACEDELHGAAMNFAVTYSTRRGCSDADSKRRIRAARRRLEDAAVLFDDMVFRQPHQVDFEVRGGE